MIAVIEVVPKNKTAICARALKSTCIPDEGSLLQLLICHQAGVCPSVSTEVLVRSKRDCMKAVYGSDPEIAIMMKK